MLSRQELLTELERRARRSLSTSKAESLVADASEHLDASIQARLEMGSTPEAAEREATAAFGTPREIVKGVVAVDRAHFQGVFLGCTTASALGCAFAVLLSPALGSRVVTMAWIVFSATFGLFVEASKHRRPWKAVLLATLVFWLAFTAMCAVWTRDFSMEGWLMPRHTGPIDLSHAALWGGAGAGIFFGYLVLAYRMARPASPKRGLG